MDALHRHVGALLDGALRQLIAEIAMRAVGFVHHQHRVVVMTDFRDAFEVARNAVVSRRDDQNALAVRVLLEHLFHLAGRDAAVQAPFRLDLRHDIHRLAAAYDQPHQHGFMGVAGDRDLIAAVGRRNNHHLVAAGGSVH